MGEKPRCQRGVRGGGAGRHTQPRATARQVTAGQGLGQGAQRGTGLGQATHESGHPTGPEGQEEGRERGQGPAVGPGRGEEDEDGRSGEHGAGPQPRCPGEQEDRRPCTPHTWQLLPEPAGHVRGQWGQRRQQLRAPPRPRASQVSVRPSEAGAAHGLGRRLHTTWATGSSSSVTQAEGQRGCGGLGFSAACSGPAAPQVPSHLQGPGLSSCKPSARGLPASSRAGLRAAVFWDGGVLPYLAPSLAP